MADFFWVNSTFESWSFDLSEVLGVITSFATKQRPGHKFTCVSYIASCMVSAESTGSLDRVTGIIGLQPTLHIRNRSGGQPIFWSCRHVQLRVVVEAEVALDTISLFIFCRDDWPK